MEETERHIMSDKIEKTAQEIETEKIAASKAVGQDGEKNAELIKQEKEQAEAKAKADAEAAKAEKERNAEFARKRRETEQKEALAKAKLEGIIAATGGINPYTDEKITDQADVDELLLMKQIEADGGDPISDYHKYLKKQQKETKTVTKDEEWSKNDWQNFETKHPDVTLDTLSKDERFLAFAEGKIGNKPLADIYDSYLKFFKVDTTKEKKVVIDPTKASPGALGGQGGGGEEQYFTLEQIKGMTQAEVNKNYKKVIESYEHHTKK